jgi:hypothetical protein
MLPALFEKVSYGIALVVLQALHRLPRPVSLVGSVDWVFAVLFLAAFLKTPPRGTAAA